MPLRAISTDGTDVLDRPHVLDYLAHFDAWVRDGMEHASDEACERKALAAEALAGPYASGGTRMDGTARLLRAVGAARGYYPMRTA